MKTILFTHNDLDGIACAVVAQMFYKNVDVNYCTYSNVTETIKDRLSELKEPHRIIISDLSYPESEKDITIELLSVHDVVVADHHPTSLWMKDVFKWEKGHAALCEADGEICGSSLLYILLKQLTEKEIDEKVNERFQKFLFYVNLWDTWQWVEEDGVKEDVFRSKSLWLHNCHKCWGTDVFVDQMRAWVKFGEGELETFMTEAQRGSVERYQNRQREEIEKTLQTNRLAKIDSPKYGLLNFVYMDDEGFNPSLVSLVAHLRGYDNGVDFIAIKPKDQLSLRYPKEGLDLSIVAKELGGGGHHNAAGVPWSSEVEKKITWL